jgi:spore maturation protein SpmB
MMDGSSLLNIFFFTSHARLEIMTRNVVPSLSTHGWVDKPAEKADLLLTHFFYSMKSQTTIYGSNVASFQWILEQHPKDIARAVEETRRTLFTYLSRYYDSVNVEITERTEDPEKSSTRVEMVISAIVTEAGVDYQLNKLVKLLDGRFKEFTNINNTETET